MLDLSKTAEEIGLRTLPLKVNMDDLENKIPLPCIVHWNYSHFIVVYKITKKKIFVSDPQIGLLAYSKKEFSEGWRKSNEKWYVLTIEPRVEFEKQENLKTTRKLTKFYKYIFAYKKYFTQIFIGIILTLGLNLIFPMITQGIVDIGINTKDITFVNVLLIASIVLTLSSVISGYTQSRLMLFIADRVNISMVSDFIYKLVQLPLPFFERKTTSDILARVGDHGRIQAFIFQTILGSISSILSILVFASILIYYEFSLFLVFIIAEAIFICWVLLFLPKRKRMDYLFFDANVANQAQLLDICDGIKEIKINNLQQKKRWDWEKSRFEIYSLNFKLLNLNQMQGAGSVLIGQLKNLFLTFISAKAVISGEMTLGMMLSVQYIIGQLNGPMGSLLALIQSFQDAKISLERVNEVIYDEETEVTHVGVKSTITGNESITLEKVCFQYNKNQLPVLDNIDLIIPGGKVTAIVGESGSGKSTLMKLLFRFYSPTEGNIKIGDSDFCTVDLNEWREKIGAVLQDGLLFTGTLLENITLDKTHFDKERLEVAIRMVNLNSYVNKLPLRHYTAVGNGGTGMSGGQKQRILIARAFYKNPDFLFLDEATNSLDANNERIITDNLANFTKGKTAVIIAHRLSTVMNAHQIVVLDKGKLVELGNHEELVKMNGYYYNLIKNQIFIK